jgi:hypothetical protein
VSAAAAPPQTTTPPHSTCARARALPAIPLPLFSCSGRN